MKKMTGIFMALLFFLLGGLFSQINLLWAGGSELPDDRIYGTWKGTSVVSYGGVSPETKQEIHFTFKEDGTVITWASATMRRPPQSLKRQWNCIDGCMIFDGTMGTIKVCPSADYKKLEGGFTGAGRDSTFILYKK